MRTECNARTACTATLSSSASSTIGGGVWMASSALGRSGKGRIRVLSSASAAAVKTVCSRAAGSSPTDAKTRVASCPKRDLSLESRFLKGRVHVRQFYALLRAQL